MSRLRGWRIVVLCVVGVLLLIGVGGCIYLNSAAAARHVASALSTALGAPVEIEGASIGLGHTDVRKVRVLEAGAPPGSTPWVTVERLNLKLSLWDAVFGAAQPREVVLWDPDMAIRLDPAGKVLTALPESKRDGPARNIPPIRIENGRLTIVRDGLPDARFEGITASLTPDGSQLEMAGKMADRGWGDWSFGGSINRNSGAGSAWLQVPASEVTQEELTQLPFIPPSIWHEVQFDGITPAQGEFTYNPDVEPAFSYQIMLAPSTSTVSIPAIDLTATDVSGHVTIQNGQVKLHGIEGDAAGGELRLDSEIDFSKVDRTLMHFDVEAKDLGLRELPKSWHLPPKINGLLTGTADLTVVATRNGIEHSGTGHGKVQAPRLGCMPEPGALQALSAAGGVVALAQNTWTLPMPPITFVLMPAAKGFQFQTAMGDSKAESEPPPPPPPPPEPKEPAVESKGGPSGPVSMVLQWLGYILDPDAAKQDRTYLTVNLGLDDVDIGAALKQLEIKSPTALAGRVTLKFTADIPTDSPDDFKTYRLKGSVASKRLEVEGVPLEDLSARIDVRNSILRVEELSARFPQPSKGGAAGSFKGSGDMRLAEAYPFRAKFNVEGIDLAAVAKMAQVLPFPISGVLTANAAVEGTATPFKLNGAATVKATDARIGILPLDGLTLKLSADGDHLKIDSATASLLGGEMTASGTIPLRGSMAGKVTLEIKNVDLGKLTKQLPPTMKLRIDGEASGSITANIPAPKQGASRRIEADVDISAPKLRLQNLATERIKGTGSYADGRLSFKLTGAFATGGSFDVTGEYPSTPKKREPKQPEPDGDGGLTGTITIDSLRLSALSKALGLPRSLAALEGLLSLNLKYRVDADGNVTGVGTLTADRVRYDGREIIPRVRAVARLTENQLRIENLTAPIGTGEARGLLLVNLADPDRSRLILTLNRIPTSIVPRLRDVATGNVDVTIRSSLGRQVRGNGTITLVNGTIGGAPARDLRVPVDWNVSPTSGRGDVVFRDLTGTLAQGQIKGHATMMLFADQPPRIKGELQFNNANLQTLTSAAESISGANQVSGRFDFASDRLRTANDLTGTLSATLGQTRPFQLPVLSDVLPFVGGGRSNMSTTKSGEVYATLSLGVFRVQRFSLSGNSIDLFADGTLTLAGRLDLNMTVSTRNLPIDPLALRLFGIRVPLQVGPVPVGLILEVSRYLSNRVVYLGVTGTLSRPSVRIKTLETLSEAAVRYFLDRSLPGATAVTPAR